MAMDSFTIGVLVFVCILVGCVLLTSAIQTFRRFRQELRYINSEIGAMWVQREGIGSVRSVGSGGCSCRSIRGNIDTR